MIIRTLIIRAVNIASEAFVMAFRNVVKEGAAAKPLQQQSKAGDAVAKAMTTNPIDLSEATQILNVEFGVTKEEFDEKFKTMFDNNDVENGGSFYLQSKIFRARETVLPLFHEGVLEKPEEK